jgi:hypothetical protein
VFLFFCHCIVSPSSCCLSIFGISINSFWLPIHSHHINWRRRKTWNSKCLILKTPRNSMLNCTTSMRPGRFGTKMWWKSPSHYSFLIQAIRRA